MAEQVSHNVVDTLESTSGSPPVDAVANHTIAAPAPDAAIPTKLDSPINDTISLPLSAPDSTEQGPAASAAPLVLDPVAATTEPSAGDAVASAATEAARSSAPLTLESEVAPQDLLVNGVVDAVSHADLLNDEKTPEGSVDVSLNSDTEGSRADGSDQKKDDKGQARTSSVKKPATFSRVSVTKNFMAKSATTTPVIAKNGEKVAVSGSAPAPLALVKPRLIAKTGTSLRDIQKARLTPDAAAGPDPSSVWNKNRAATPAPQKQFTDEELKQQYGIHLATRLQTDENDKEAKWADIDEDEDDWAPEAVVWMDGTKSSLTPQEVPVVQPEEKPAAQQPATVAEPTRPKVSILKPTELGPQKTILKPGASAAAAQQAKQSGATGAAGEKPSLKAKSPAPAPVKSPWAPLPPVDSTSPIHPPVQQPPPPRSFATQDARMSQDARAYDAPPPMQAAREIAADTFDRSWREGEGGPRELFNSANGRYEQVSEGRRASGRQDRKPAVLQRTSHNDVPTTDSAVAGQGKSDLPLEGTLPGRRGSSVSHGSILSGRRPSASKASEVSSGAERQGSVGGGNDARLTPGSRGESAQPSFNQQSAWQQQMPPKPDGSMPEQEDPVKAQERIMREKRELARKRKQEEDLRLEAEKQERLRARLAVLEGAGKSRKEREAEAAASSSAVAASATAKVQSPSAEKTSASSQPSPEKVLAKPAPAKPAEASAQAAPAPEAQISPLPQPPSQAANDGQAPATTVPVPGADAPGQSVPGVGQSKHQQQQSRLSPKANARTPFHQQSPAFRAASSSYSSPGDRKREPFSRSPLQNNDAFTPWPATANHGNVWGSSGIGNGTFEGANGFSPLPSLSSLPQLPGMGRSSASTRISPQALGQETRSPTLQQQATMESTRGLAPPGLEPLPPAFVGQARTSVPSPGPGLGRQAHLPGPIAPPSRAASQAQQQQPRQDPLAAWNSAAERLPIQYNMDARAAERRRDEVRVAPREDTIRETFKQTSTTRLGGPRKYDKTEVTIHQGGKAIADQSEPAPPNVQTQPPSQLSAVPPMQQGSWKSAGESTVRIPDGSVMASPQPPIGPPGAHQTRRGQLSGPGSQQQRPLAVESSSKDDAPPPPESFLHPVNSGDATHPLVKLPPGSKPKVVVRLPPAPTTQQTPAQHGAVAMPPRPVSNRGGPGAQPLVQSEMWQARFNGLFNRAQVQTEIPPSPPKTPPRVQGAVLAVASSSRTAMEEARTAPAATISLPHSRRHPRPADFAIDDSGAVVSKPGVDQMFNEELSFGFKPRTVVPRKPRYAQHVYVASPVNLLELGPSNEAMAVQSQPELSLHEVHPKRREGFYVHMPARVAKLSRRLARASEPPKRRPAHEGQDARKVSGRQGKGKGKDGDAAAADGPARGAKTSSTPGSPATVGGPASASRKASGRAPGPHGRKTQQAVAAPSA